MTTKEQEEHVGGVLAAEYERVSGALLEGNTESPSDPPDRVFTWRGLLVGAEMFELEQFHGATALFDTLAGEAYDAFRARATDNRLVGLVVQVHLRGGMGPSQMMTIARSIKKSLRRARLQLRAVGNDVAELALASVGGRDLSRDIHWHVPVDPVRYPALANIADSVSFSSTRPDYPGSEDNLPHLIPVARGLHLDASDSRAMVDRIKGQIAEKMDDRHKWLPVNHSILVAHDTSRTRLSPAGLDEHWVHWVRAAAKGIDVLSAFDELWLVTAWKWRREPDGGYVGEPNGAVRIVGRNPVSDRGQ
jgi:hypothetical protein